MRIAIQNCWPNIPHCAEKELINRVLIAAERLGWQAAEVVTSDDILAFAPDCVLVTHEYSPKLTGVPTIGLMWSPPSLFDQDPYRIKSVLSYDGVIPASEPIARWLKDLFVSVGKDVPVADFAFFPSCYELDGSRPPGLRSAFYAGVHWDGARFGYLFEELAKRIDLRVYGPEDRWRSVGDAWRGQIPFDGAALLEKLRDAGIALCLHKAAHRACGVPTMRIFEAAAAGALIITDDFDFPRQAFRDTALYVDHELPPDAVVERIVSHVEWANAFPGAAAELAARANAIFRAEFSLETQLKRLPAFVDEVRAAGRFPRRGSAATAATGREPLVEYVVRIGSRPTTDIATCLKSLADQTAGPIGVILAQYHPVEGLDALIRDWEPRFARIRVVPVPNTGHRSTALWAGLKAVTAPFFGVQDDDDTVQPNHVATILDVFDRHAEAQFVYTGTVKVEDEPGHWFRPLNFEGPAGKVVEENRWLQFLDVFEPERLWEFDNYIQSNAWLARRTLLDVLPEDPGLEVAEDVYLYQLFLTKTAFHTTFRPTAEWHWRTTSQGNSMTSVPGEVWMREIDRIRKRLQFSRPGNKKDIAALAGDVRANAVIGRDLAP